LLFELVVYLRIPPENRLERLRQREMARYGERIMPGGDMYEQSQAFLAWAAAYDDGGLDMRSRCLHEQWLGALPCPVVRIEGEHTTEEQLEMLMRAIQP
ncbi:MAG: hypothetical protein ETSY1_44915, partial [Candidatus Entotheonella factor]